MDPENSVTMAELERGLAHILQSPTDDGVLEMIVRRPEIDAREQVDSAELDTDDGLIGDSWQTRGSKRTTDGSANRAQQITLMNSRAAALIAQERDCWALAGDQLFVDLDLSQDNLPPGARLQIGGVVLEISALPHTGCKKFRQRFGLDALKFVASAEAKQLRLRGANAMVVQSGVVRVGDPVRKLD